MKWTKKELATVAGGLLLVFCFGIANNTLGFYMLQITEEFGIIRTAFTLYYTMLAGMGMVSAPFFGKIYNRIDTRKLMIGGGVAALIAYCCISFANGMAVFYIVGGLFGLLQSAISMSLTAYILVRVFGERSGTPMGICMAGTGVVGLVFGLVIPPLVESFGWRFCYRLQGVVWLVLAIIAGMLIGNVNEGRMEENRQESGKPQAQLTTAQVFRLPVFWILIIAGMLMNFSALFSQHMVPYAVELGIDPITAGRIFSFYSIWGIIGKILLGWLFNRLQIKHATMLANISLVLGLLLFSRGQYPVMLVACAFIGFGLAESLMAIPIINRAVFGAENFAFINGLTAIGTGIGAAFGSNIWAAFYDVTGSYALAIPAFSAIYLLVGVLYWIVLSMPRPKM